MMKKDRVMLAALIPLDLIRDPYWFQPLWSDTTTTVYKDGCVPEGVESDWEKGLVVWSVSAKYLPTRTGIPAAKFVAMRAHVKVYDVVPDGYTDLGIRVFYRRRWVENLRLREGVVLRNGMTLYIGNKKFMVVIF